VATAPLPAARAGRVAWAVEREAAREAVVKAAREAATAAAGTATVAMAEVATAAGWCLSAQRAGTAEMAVAARVGWRGKRTTASRRWAA
jgi:hypothetical protein